MCGQGMEGTKIICSPTSSRGSCQEWPLPFPNWLTHMFRCCKGSKHYFEVINGKITGASTPAVGGHVPLHAEHDILYHNMHFNVHTTHKVLSNKFNSK